MRRAIPVQGHRYHRRMATRARSEGTLQVTSDPAASRLLNTDPLALLIDAGPQVPLEAFMAWPTRGPPRPPRAGGSRRWTPRLRRGPRQARCTGTRPMARRTHAWRVSDRAMATPPLVDGRRWPEPRPATELPGGRSPDLRGHPGRAWSWPARLGGRYGQVRRPHPRPRGRHRSPESLARVRQWKKAQKAAHKDTDRPLNPDDRERASERTMSCTT
jgi:hypothetical protein